MNTGADRPVAQVGSDPTLVAFSEAAHRHALMPGWEFQGGLPNAPVPAEQPYRWSWSDVLRPMMVKAIPHWTWVQHENRSATEPAFLFGATDTPILEAFGLYREEVSPGPAR